MGDKGARAETIQEATCNIPAGDDLGQAGDRCGIVENSSISGYILKTEPTGFNVGLE